MVSLVSVRSVNLPAVTPADRRVAYYASRNFSIAAVHYRVSIGFSSLVAPRPVGLWENMFIA